MNHLLQPADLEKVQGRTPRDDRSTVGVGAGNSFVINLVTRDERWAELQNTGEYIRLTKAIMDLTENMTNPKIDKVVINTN
jgi:hypothetical protein